MSITSVPWTPWHKVVTLREDLLTGELALNQFAADLYEVLMQRGKNPIYEDCKSFFSLTFPAANLRVLTGDVVQRLAGKNDKAVHQLALTYGGGKTHTLITLAHLVRDPSALPDTPAVGEFKTAAGIPFPRSRVAALCFDKIDAVNGLEVLSPDGAAKRFKYPWSILAWQIAGEKGIAELNIDHPQEERDTPPAEDPLLHLLEPALRDDMPLLILVDEVLMYARTMAEKDSKWRTYLINFFQALTQAVSKTSQCCLVASLLSSRPEDNDIMVGATLETELSNIFGRQQQGSIVTVARDEVSEILRRRFFTPDSIRDPSVFRAHVQKVIANIAVIDDYTKTHMAEQEQLYGKNYPFHPEIIDVFYAKWNSLPTFQRTRGLLRTFALALRDAVKWDGSPLIGPSVFLPSPESNDLPPATQDLVSIADRAVETASAWGSILRTELDRAKEADSSFGMKHRETEQAVVAVFLHSQPISMDCPVSKLWPMVSMGKPQKIDLEKALRQWADTSFWLDDQLTGTGGVPQKWKLGNKPNLNQMHDSQKKLLSNADKKTRLLEQVKSEKSLTSGVDSCVAIHRLPSSPADVSDDGRFHFVVLPPEGVCDGATPSDFARRFLVETAHAASPRIHCNAIILLAPEKHGLDIAMERVADVLAWQKVRDDLRDQSTASVDQSRLSTLGTLLNAANGKLADAVRQAWCMAVMLDEKRSPQSFKLNLGSNSPFAAIKRDSRTRVQSSAINAESLLPEGPYNLWGKNDSFRTVKDIFSIFTKLPNMPKMLSLDPIRDTIKDGCRDGIFVLRLPRPDGSARTWWKSTPDETSLNDQALELWLPHAATLESIDPAILLPDSGLQLWPDGAEEISVKEIAEFFSGDKEIVRHMDGYDEPMSVPSARPDAIFEAVAKAVEDGSLWLINITSSVLGEKIPTGVLTETARLRRPPDPISGFKLSPEHLPDAWRNDSSTVKTIADVLSQEAGVPLPWFTVRDAVSSAISARCIEIDPAGGSWPCDYASSSTVKIRIPDAPPPPSILPSKGNAAVTNFNLSPEQLYELQDIAPDILKWVAEHNVLISFDVSVVQDTPIKDIDETAKAELINILSRFQNH